MKKKIKRISPLQLGKISAAIYGFLSILFIPFLFMSMFATKNKGPGIVFILFMPVIYIVMGFIMAVITAAIYNLCAKWVGGIEIEFEDEDISGN